MSNSHGDDGFTLLEILIVVTIIGALMAILIANYAPVTSQANVELATMQLRRIEQALEFYRIDNKRYPTTEQGLEALVRPPASEPAPRHYRPGGYMPEKLLLDPWDSPYYYEYPGQHNTHAFDLASWGPDGVEGGEGDNADIVNWDTGTLD